MPMLEKDNRIFLAGEPTITEGFVFDPLLYVKAGQERDDGVWFADQKRFLDKLRRAYPELNCWGDLPLGVAWRSYSMDVFGCEWVIASLSPRDGQFLTYLRHRQHQGANWRWVGAMTPAGSA